MAAEVGEDAPVAEAVGEGSLRPQVARVEGSIVGGDGVESLALMRPGDLVPYGDHDAAGPEPVVADVDLTFAGGGGYHQWPGSRREHRGGRQRHPRPAPPRSPEYGHNHFLLPVR